ncbi:MAG: RluA family pseudouridine synthase, partial [Candidatus Omnitrophica bacterium]|nr:RluA family pseudouridine synthase [Candidatus Omnitrophota bacterium]
FRKRSVKKVYVAFVNGIVKKKFDTIKDPIYNRNKRKTDDAVTKYTVMEKHAAFTVIEAEPVTGRTNQIRIHMKAIGHPLVGETVYAFRKDFKLRFKRAALHAKRIEFNHPVTGEKMSFESPLAADMVNFLKGAD